MIPELNAISDAVSEINRALLLMSNSNNTANQSLLLENALTVINEQFEKEAMHEIRQAFEDN